jgi:hypothetical protein
MSADNDEKPLVSGSHVSIFFRLFPLKNKNRAKTIRFSFPPVRTAAIGYGRVRSLIPHRVSAKTFAPSGARIVARLSDDSDSACQRLYSHCGGKFNENSGPIGAVPAVQTVQSLRSVQTVQLAEATP